MKYVSVYERGRSPFWYIAYPDPITGKRINRATVHRIEDLTSKRKAYDEACQLAKEAAVTQATTGEAWGAWVDTWIKLNHRGRTLKAYEDRWKTIRFFLAEKLLTVPRAVRYEHAEGFLVWRTSQKRHRGTNIAFNTALTELRLFSKVMTEAVRRGYADGNPLVRLGLRKDEIREKPEITDEEDRIIREALLTRPAWMLECYHIAMCQGCRLTETKVPMSRVDLARNAITFYGKGNKRFTTQLHPALRPLVERKFQERKQFLCDLPDAGTLPAKQWWAFFREIKLPHLCFHCTKVTVVTRLCRAGVSQGVAMSYVNHSKAEVHRVYQRLGLKDVGAAVSALASIPALPATPGA